MSKVLSIYFIFICVLFALPLGAQTSSQEIDYPAMFEANTNVNIRKNPNAHSRKLGILKTGEQVEILSVSTNGTMNWGKMQLTSGKHGYVCMKYLKQKVIEKPEETSSSEFSSWSEIKDFLNTAGRWLGYLVIIGMLLLAYYLREVIAAVIGTYIFFAIVGAIIGFFFGNASKGAGIACWVVTVVGGVYLLISYGGSIRRVIFGVLCIPFIPLYLLNQLQWVLIAPWRWLFKSDWLNEDVKSFIRPCFTFLSIILAILTTPLRTFNAIVYNTIHVIYEFYNYILEVLIPSADDEGAEGVWSWCLHFIVRVFKYPIFHGIRSLWDSIIGTILDIFYPTVTLYHGTTETAANNILADNNRNSHQQRYAHYLRGTFKASSQAQCSWAGLGVYFAKSLFLASSYAYSDRNSDGTDPILIVSRVSYGLIISYNLAPCRVSYNTGRYGHHPSINNWTMSQGYTTGEWWNGYNWEYCLFDWQNRYNEPWRIRPIYAFNLSTLFFHHIKGGMRHWDIGDKAFDL